MFRKTPEKFVRASNLIFFVTFLKLLNVIILEIIPTGRISVEMVGILVLFLVSGFLLRKGFKWMVLLMPLIMLFPWVLLQTNIIHVFNTNPLAGIITGAQFFAQVVIMEILLSSSESSDENRGRPSRAIRA
ncbi:MAG TPA: hypothetical protein VK809_08925 [Bacteroidia bacterium]|nr:hypothetical protein [Bacteroidia bacterium]